MTEASAPFDDAFASVTNADEAVGLFVALLAEERERARRADLDGLAELADPKFRALTLLAKFDVSDDVREELARRARENILLIRHLAAFFKSLTVDEERSTYTTAGTRNQAVLGRNLGAL